MRFTKRPLTFQEQVQLLKSRHLIVDDEAEAVAVLQRVSYYRLSAYFPPFQTERDVFDRGTTLESILRLYEFDRKLQNLLLDILAGIEIATRTQLAYHLAHTYGAFGYLNSDNFYLHFNHYHWLEKVRENIGRSHETFIKHFFGKYTSESDLPIWMVCEAISFGQISQLLRGLKKKDRQAIAGRHFGINHVLMTSWLHTAAYVRNLCAHHSRIWNRVLAIRPIRDREARSWIGIRNDKIYSVLLILKSLSSASGEWEQWNTRLSTLLKEYPDVDVTEMGFADDWEGILFGG